MNIKMVLSSDSVSNAIRELEEYRDSLVDKNYLFIKRLSDLGYAVIENNIALAEGAGDPPPHTTVKIHSFGDYCEAIVTSQGKEILFIEFGAGIHYNKSDPEHAKEFGYGVGTYPGQTNAFNEDGWYYKDDAGYLQHSYGTKATSPMLRASHEIIANIRKIAREIYGS